MIPTPEMLKAARDAFPNKPFTEAIEAALTAALALLPGEPVGYTSQENIDALKKNPTWRGAMWAKPLGEGFDASIPLYAFPAPQPVCAQLTARKEAKLKADVARLIDGEAWKAMDDGRDRLEGSLWHLRRDWALEKAIAAISLVRAAISISPPAAVQEPVAVKAFDDLTLPVVATLFVARGAATARAVSGVESGPSEYSDLVRMSDVAKALEPFRSALSSPVEGGTEKDEDGARTVVIGEETISQLRSGKSVSAGRVYLLPADDLAAASHVATVEDHNDAFDPADEAFGGAFKDGFREGWLFAKSPDFEDRDEAEEDYPREVDIAPSECWDAYRSRYFEKLPLAAIPEVGAPIASPSSAEIEALQKIIRDQKASLLDYSARNIRLNEQHDELQAEIEALRVENETLREELGSAASLLETLSDDLDADDTSGVMMRVMAQRNRAALQQQEEGK